MKSRLHCFLLLPSCCFLLASSNWSQTVRRHLLQSSVLHAVITILILLKIFLIRNKPDFWYLFILFFCHFRFCHNDVAIFAFSHFYRVWFDLFWLWFLELLRNFLISLNLMCLVLFSIIFKLWLFIAGCCLLVIAVTNFTWEYVWNFAANDV